MGRVLLVSHEVDLEDNITLRDVILMKWFNERREGPFEVVRSTGTAVQVKGSPTWYHLSHCVKAPQGEEPRLQKKSIPFQVVSPISVRFKQLRVVY
uniref:Murine leukemia virus integrase C-terminal domain-containing protein n=1 Tax=Amphiprion percula TaxID=161767 RepID=A0A3P8TUD9_AMPPE